MLRKVSSVELPSTIAPSLHSYRSVASYKLETGIQSNTSELQCKRLTRLNTKANEVNNMSWQRSEEHGSDNRLWKKAMCVSRPSNLR